MLTIPQAVLILKNKQTQDDQDPELKPNINSYRQIGQRYREKEFMADTKICRHET